MINVSVSAKISVVPKATKNKNININSVPAINRILLFFIIVLYVISLINEKKTIDIPIPGSRHLTLIIKASPISAPVCVKYNTLNT